MDHAVCGPYIKKILRNCNFKFNSAEPCSKMFDPSLSGEFAPWTELEIESAINITWVSSGSEFFGWTFASYYLAQAGFQFDALSTAPDLLIF